MPEDTTVKLSLYRWLDAKIPQEMTLNVRSMYRARLFFALYGLFIASFIIFATILTLFPGSNEIIRINRPIFVLMAFLYGFSGYLFIAKQRVQLSAFLILLALLGGVFLASLVLLVRYQILSYALLMLPIIAFLISGKSIGALYSAIVLLSQCVLIKMYIDEYAGVSANLVSERGFFGEMLLMILVAITVIASCVIYERMLVAMESQLEVEKNLHRQFAQHDMLTNLPNQHAFELKVQGLINTNTRFAIVYLDIDGFNDINEKYGHEAGDEILAIFGKRMKASVRSDDFVSHFAGDKFAILLKNVVSRGKALERDEEIYRRLEREISFSGNIEKITISRGVVLFPDDERSYTALMSHADVSMYEQKLYTNRNSD